MELKESYLTCVDPPQAPPPPYYTVGMDNKGLDGSMDTGLDDPSKTAIYSSQQYHNYTQNGHINNAQNNNGELAAVRWSKVLVCILVHSFWCW